MDWRYLAELFKGVFWNTHSWLFSIPAYLSVLALLPMIFQISEGWKMKIVLPVLRKHSALICMSLLMISVILTSHSMYANKSLRLATPDELVQSVLKDRDIRLVDLARESPVIRNKTFRNCHFYGPAVFRFGGGSILRNCHMEGPAEYTLIETTNDKVKGIIKLESCTVQDCWFHNIAFIGSSQEVAQWTNSGLTHSGQ